MSSQRVRPVGVIIIAVLMVLGGIVGVVSGLFFVPMAGMMGMNYLGALGAVAGGFFVALGFGSIALIMSVIMIAYFYHIHLINQISGTQEIFTAQRKIAELKTAYTETKDQKIKSILEFYLPEDKNLKLFPDF